MKDYEGTKHLRTQPTLLLHDAFQNLLQAFFPLSALACAKHRFHPPRGIEQSGASILRCLGLSDDWIPRFKQHSQLPSLKTCDTKAQSHSPQVVRIAQEGLRNVQDQAQPRGLLQLVANSARHPTQSKQLLSQHQRKRRSSVSF